jgi:hypothetical protein
VRLRHAQFVPSEILLTREPWGSRLIALCKVRAWRVEDSYNSDWEYVPFFSPPLPPMFNHRLGRLPLAPACLPPAPGTDNDYRGDRGIDGVDDALLPHEVLLAILDNVEISPRRCPSSLPSSGSSHSSHTLMWDAGAGSPAVSKDLSSGPPLASSTSPSASR